jgi:tRNA(fMet)-specific endonuclease VapC
MILMDTDVCIELLRGNAKVMRRREAYRGEVGVCFMTVAELFYGAEKSGFPEENHRLVERFLLAAPVLQTEERILKRFGKVKASLKRASNLMPDADIFIAAATLEKAEGLVTGNGRHFQRIEGLRLEDWLR